MEKTSFTTKQFEILDLFMKGFNSQQIADLLGVSLQAIGIYRKDIINKAAMVDNDEHMSFKLAFDILDFISGDTPDLVSRNSTIELQVLKTPRASLAA